MGGPIPGTRGATAKERKQWSDGNKKEAIESRGVLPELSHLPEVCRWGLTIVGTLKVRARSFRPGNWGGEGVKRLRDVKRVTGKGRILGCFPT